MAVTTGPRRANQAKTYLEPGDATTCTATAGVTGKRFVKVGTGGVGNHPNVITAVAGGPAYGVAHFDASAGQQVSVLREGTVEVTTGGANLTAGNEVEVGAAGVAVVLSAGRPVGVCTADTLAGAGAPITLY